VAKTVKRFDAETRHQLAKLFAQAAGWSKREVEALSSFDWSKDRILVRETRASAAVDFVWHLECLLREVRPPARNKEAGAEQLEKVEGALIKAADYLKALTSAEAMALVSGVAREMEETEFRRLAEFEMKWNLHATLQAMSPDKPVTRDLRASAREQAKMRLAEFPMGGLFETTQDSLSADLQSAADSEKTLMAMAEAMALLARGAQRGRRCIPGASKKPQAGMASIVVDTLASYDIKPGGRDGVGAEVLEILLRVAGLPGSPGRLIETASAQHQKARKNRPADSVR
jgi:hypothetical protein